MKDEQDRMSQMTDAMWKGAQHFLDAQKILKALYASGQKEELERTLAQLGRNIDLDEFLAAKTYEDFLRCLEPHIGPTRHQN